MPFVQTTHTLVPGSLANDAAIGSVAWTNPGNATSANSPGATCTLGAGVTSNYIKGTNCGAAIPTSCIVEGIEVSCDVKASALGLIREQQIVLVALGTPLTVSKDFGLITFILTFVAKTAGALTDLWSWTEGGAGINDSGFGCAVAITNIGVLSADVELKNLRIKVKVNTDFIAGGMVG